MVHKVSILYSFESLAQLYGVQLVALAPEHSELGDGNDYAAIKTATAEVCKVVSTTAKRAAAIEDKLDMVVATAAKKSLSSLAAQMGNIFQQIRESVSAGIKRPDFAVEREGQLRNFAALVESIQIAHSSLYTQIRIAELEAKTLGQPDDLLKQAAAAVAEIQGMQANLTPILEQLKKRAAEVASANVGATLGTLAGRHSKMEMYWGFASVGMLAITLGLFGYALFEGPNLDMPVEGFISFAKHLIAIGLSFSLLRFAVDKYLIERNLSIVLDHRSTVAEQFQIGNLMAAAGPTEPQLRIALEFAKYLCSDPRTGYLERQSGSKISPSMLINIIEKLSQKAPPS